MTLTRTRCLSALLAPLAIPVAAAAQGFEGRVTAEMHGQSGQTMPVVMLVKGAKSRMEVSMGGMDVYMIVDGESQQMLSVMPAQKMYMRMDLKQAAQGMPGMQGQRNQAPPKITRTGRHETIAGRDCEHVLFDTERVQMDICAAKGMGVFTGGMGGGPMGGRGRGQGVPAGYDELMKEFKDGFFPLKIETVDGTTRNVMMLVTAIEPQRVDASQFVPPAGFQEMQMPMGMPGMGRP
jgi:hypothetical protein